MSLRQPVTLAALAALAMALGGGEGAAATAAAPGPSLASAWVDETPDAMVAAASQRLSAPGATKRSLMASLVTLNALGRQARRNAVFDSFEAAASAPTLAPDVRDQAGLLARRIAPDRGTESGQRSDLRFGIVEDVALLGPFRDTGGGLSTHDGPEARGATFANMGARYSWGAFEVAWRAVPRAFASAAGIPLDLFVHPRKESCTWLATRLDVAKPQAFRILLAASGQARLVFDGVDVGRDETVHESALFDRMAARVHAEAGSHVLAAKVCSGALGDDGRARLRVVDDHGAWPAGVTAAADLGEGAKRKAVFEATPTLLDAALHAPGSGAEDELEGALVRILAGVDDLRSPRAPGMLAAAVEAGLDPDRLAVAAWVAPSGANRSAWLNRCLAHKALPAGVRAFVERRRVERLLESGLTDWAMTAVHGGSLEHASDAEAAVLTARVELALGTEALRARALGRLRAVWDQAPDAADAALLLLEQTAAPSDVALAWAVHERLEERGYAGATRLPTLLGRGAPAVVEEARRAFAGGVETADEALAVADAVAEAGAHREAEALYGQLTRFAPNDAAVWSGLAREAGASDSAHAGETVGPALRRARNLEPTDARLRAELELRSRAPKAGDASDGEQPIATFETIVARAKANGALPGDEGASDVPEVASRDLHWSRSVVMHDDHRVSELVHYARAIVIAPRTEDELYEEIPSEGDTTEILRARVHRKDGSVAYAVEQASDGGHPRLRWPELSRGDAVEVAFRSWTAGPVGGRGDPPFYRLDYAGSLSTRPLAYNEVSVDSPSDMPIFVEVLHGKADRRDESSAGGRSHVHLVWDKPVSVPDEPLAPPASEILPTVVLSTFRDWGAFRAWYGEAVRGFTDPDAEVRRLAAKLTRGRDTRDSKLRALFEFVADDIRYVNYVSGEWWLPNRPQQVLARREGDCDDKALLLITLLRACGIDAQEVLVQTRLTGQPSLLRAPGAAVPLFDHGIAFLPGPKGGTYLDATSPQSRLGPLPSMDARAVALRMDGPPEIVELPPSTPAEHGLDATWNVALHDDGSADVLGEEHASGDDAFWMRTQLTEAGARQSWVEAHLAATWLTTIEVDKKIEFEGGGKAGGADLRYKARSSGLGRHDGDELVVVLSPPSTLASLLAPLVTRTLPVQLPPSVAPRRESHAIRLTAPKGWAFAPLPPGGDEEGGPFGRAHLELTRDARDPRTVVARLVLTFEQSTIAVADYPAWRAWLQRVDALMHRSVRLARLPGGR